MKNVERAENVSKRPLVLSTAPHVFDGLTTRKIMLNVVIALMPALAASGIIFGARALLVVAVTGVLVRGVRGSVVRAAQTGSDGGRSIRGRYRASACVQPTFHHSALHGGHRFVCRHHRGKGSVRWHRPQLRESGHCRPHRAVGVVYSGDDGLCGTADSGFSGIWR